MGLSTKEASSDGLTWNKVLMQAQNLELPKPPAMRRQLPQNQQQHPPEKCPRCESMNTKFCYYNNYNKAQPRFFCKACKRHWTKGGTLRNVPVGGGRKNKRLKTSNTSSSTAAKVIATTKNTSSLASSSIDNGIDTNNITNQVQQQFYKPPLYQPFIPPAPSQLQENFNSKNFCSPNGGIFLGSASNPFFSFPSSSGQLDSSFSTISTSTQASKGSAFAAEESTFMEGLHVSTSIPTTSTNVITQPWQVPSVSSTNMDDRSGWTWDDIDKLVSSDITTTWDDNEIKP